jgi:hypothetical protein
MFEITWVMSSARSAWGSSSPIADDHQAFHWARSRAAVEAEPPASRARSHQGSTGGFGCLPPREPVVATYPADLDRDGYLYLQVVAW